MVAFNRTSGKPVAGRVEKADTHQSRGKGLLGRTSMGKDEGLWIVPCPLGWIHTFFMKFAIDALFLDEQLKVVRVMEGLKPWRLAPMVLKAHSVLELAGGSLKGSVAVGDQLEIA